MEPNEWTRRVWAEFRAGNLTRHWRDALLVLRSFRGHGGVLYPSHETIAARARMCSKTVQRALHAARELGLVTWTERRRRVGWRSVRTSNHYVLTLPPRPAPAPVTTPRGPKRPAATNGLRVRGFQLERKQEAPEGEQSRQLRLMLAAGAGQKAIEAFLNAC